MDIPYLVFLHEVFLSAINIPILEHLLMVQCMTPRILSTHLVLLRSNVHTLLKTFYHHKLVVILAFAVPLTLKPALLCSRKHTVTTVKFKVKWGLGKDLGVTL